MAGPEKSSVGMGQGQGGKESSKMAPNSHNNQAQNMGIAEKDSFQGSKPDKEELKAND